MSDPTLSEIPSETASQQAGELDSTQRKTLRGMAHVLKPLVHIGRGGLSESVLAELDQALEHHELIKVKLVDLKDQKREIGQEIRRRLDAELVGTIGHVLVLFRQAREPEHRRVEIPRGRSGR